MVLTQQSVHEAITDMVEMIRGGQPYEQSLIDQVAAEHEIHPDALRRHFEQRHPNGNIANRPETPAELDARWARSLAAQCLHRYEQYGKVDGREVMLNGQLHYHRSRKSVAEVHHCLLSRRTERDSNQL